MAPKCVYCTHPIWGRVYTYNGGLPYHPKCFTQIENEFRQNANHPTTDQKSPRLDTET